MHTDTPFYDTVPERQRIFARMLAGEDIYVVQSGTKTASFDPVQRVLRLPYWKNVQSVESDLLVAHEVGHAIFTPNLKGATDDRPLFALLERSLRQFLPAHITITPEIVRAFKTYVNVTEDARIERLIRARYRGLGKVFYKGYDALHNHRDFFGIHAGRAHPDTLPLIDRLNLAAKVGSLIRLRLTRDEQHFYDRMMATQTWDEALQLAGELFIYTAMQQSSSDDGDDGDGDADGAESGPSKKSKKSDKKKSDKKKSDKKSQSKQDADGDEDADGATAGDEDADADADGDADSGAEDGDGDDQDGPDGPVGDGDGRPRTDRLSQSDVENVPESMTDRASQNASDDMADASSSVTVKLPPVQAVRRELSKIIISPARIRKAFADHNTNAAGRVALHEKVNEYRREHMPVIDLMVQEFERRKRAQIHQRTLSMKTGNLDLTKLHKYKVTENLFLRRQIVPKGKRHGMIMMIDWSGSMQPCTSAVLQQILNMVLFCRKLNIPFDVYAFTNSFGTGSHYTVNAADGTTVPYGTWLLHLLSSTASTVEFNEMVEWITLLQTAYGGDGYQWLKQYNLEVPALMGQNTTPLYRAMLTLPAIAAQFREQHNIEKLAVVLMTDGGDNNDMKVSRVLNGDGNPNAMSRLDTSDTLQDTDTRMIYPAGTSMYSRLAEWVGHRAGAEMIGIHLISGVNPISASHIYDRNGKAEPQRHAHEITKQFASGWAAMPFDTGFAEAYVVDTEKLRPVKPQSISGRTAAEVEASATAYRTARESSKSMAKHMVNTFA